MNENLHCERGAVWRGWKCYREKLMASEKSKWVILKFLPLLNLRCITRCRRSLLAELGTPLSSISIDNNNNNNSISRIQHNVRRVIRNQTQSPGCDLFVWLSSQQLAHIDQQNTNTLIHAILLDTRNHFFVFLFVFLIVKAIIIEVYRHFYQKKLPMSQPAKSTHNLRHIQTNVQRCTDILSLSISEF